MCDKKVRRGVYPRRTSVVEALPLAEDYAGVVQVTVTLPGGEPLAVNPNVVVALGANVPFQVSLMYELPLGRAPQALMMVAPPSENVTRQLVIVLLLVLRTVMPPLKPPGHESDVA